jgi:hypothetical protein
MYSGRAIILDYHGNERQRNFYRHHWVVKSEWTINDDGETYFFNLDRPRLRHIFGSSNFNKHALDNQVRMDDSDAIFQF